ncbi:MAG: hypothetical protein EP332_09805 [Bacteroidetes bacterium]|nr:MAG: hypothetical protein EP332_09805 [Bacteroidota bacterium]
MRIAFLFLSFLAIVQQTGAQAVGFFTTALRHTTAQNFHLPYPNYFEANDFKSNELGFFADFNLKSLKEQNADETKLQLFLPVSFSKNNLTYSVYQSSYNLITQGENMPLPDKIPFEFTQESLVFGSGLGFKRFFNPSLSFDLSLNLKLFWNIANFRNPDSQIARYYPEIESYANARSQTLNLGSDIRSSLNMRVYGKHFISFRASALLTKKEASSIEIANVIRSESYFLNLAPHVRWMDLSLAYFYQF